MPCAWFPLPRSVRFLLGSCETPGIALNIGIYIHCFVLFFLSAGWVVTYGSNEEALEATLRSKYGKEIRETESKREKMSEVYMSAIKKPGSDPLQEERLQQLLRGGRGEVKRHQYDPKYYGTEEGLEKQRLTEEEIKLHQEEERKRMKRAKKRLKKKKKEAQEGAEAGENLETESEAEATTTSNSSKKKAAAAALAAVALASTASSSPTTQAEKEVDGKLAKKIQSRVKSSSKEEKMEKRKDLSMDMSHIATLTAVAGAAALIGFLVGGGSRRQ
jgi:hypothetical protein